MSGRKHKQFFKTEYAAEWPVLMRSTKSLNHVHCKVCKSDFSIAHGGRNDCLRHVEGSRHMRNAEASAGIQNLKTIFTSKENLDVIKAESLFTKFLLEHNLPLTAADHAGPLFKRMFPDSKIASKYRCARTKTTEIIKSFARTTQDDLCKILKSKKFCIATDGSNAISNEKLFSVVITYFDETIGKVTTTLLSLPKLDNDATGENIFSLLDDELKKYGVPWANCIAFCADNASVMLGEHKGVGAFIKKANSNIVIHGCACHLIHLAAKHATKKCADFNIENFLVDVFYYLKKSTKRINLLKLCEEACDLEDRKILKYGATRWLSMGKVIDRFLNQWDALKKFFCEEEKGTSATFLRLKDTFESPSTQLYLLFFQSVIPIFESANVLMQHEAPLIHQYQRELTSLFSSILSRFIKPTTIVDSNSIFEINFSKLKNQKSDSDLVIGGKTRQYLSAGSVPDEEVQKFYSSVRNFYIEACTYMVKKFSMTDQFYKNCEIADFKIRHEAQFYTLEFFLNLFSIPVEDRNVVEQEFAIFQTDPLNNDILSAKRCDVAWNMIAELEDHRGRKKYSLLPTVMQTILLFPHSNAACERIFSLVKKNQTEFRSSMHQSTLEALLVEKCKSGENKSCFDAVLSEEDLIKAKRATYLALKEDNEQSA